MKSGILLSIEGLETIICCRLNDDPFIEVLIEGFFWKDDCGGGCCCRGNNAASDSRHWAGDFRAAPLPGRDPRSRPRLAAAEGGRLLLDTLLDLVLEEPPQAMRVATSDGLGFLRPGPADPPLCASLLLLLLLLLKPYTALTSCARVDDAFFSLERGLFVGDDVDRLLGRNCEK